MEGELTDWGGAGGEGELTDWTYQGEGGEHQELEDYYENQKAWPSNYPNHIANRSS